MAKCYVCEKKQIVGGRITRRGLAKKKGGIGMHVVKNVKRTYYPNVQPCNIIEQGTRKKVMVCTACIRSGAVVKAG
jgi:large subunit ribosomal protein L28